MSLLLIINADDLGYDVSVNRGILQAMREGVVTSATFMVNMPSSEEAARDARGLALGLHFNLTRVAPVSPLFPEAFLQQGFLSEALASTLPPEVVEREALAQMERFEGLLGQPPTHVDVHKHLHLNENVLEGLARAAERRRLPVRSINPAMRAFLERRGIPTNHHFIGDAGTEAYWTLERLAAHVQALPKDGVVELMCHPGHAPSTVKSGYHEQREVELATFLSAEALLLLKGVPLGTYRALHPASR